MAAPELDVLGEGDSCAAALGTQGSHLNLPPWCQQLLLEVEVKVERREVW